MTTYMTDIDAVMAAGGELRAGGTDVQARRRSGIAAGPLTDISRLPGLADITWGGDGAATIGALATVDTLAGDPAIRQRYPGLAQAAGGLATPQIRRVATLGGILLQRTRCWYYRHPAFSCFKKGGDACPARTGQHQRGVIFDRGPCVHPHPSTLGMALLAYEAQVEVLPRGRLSLADLYGDGSDPYRDHTLAPGELLTQVVLPVPLPDERVAYLRAIGRFEAEWPLVEVLVRLRVEGHTIRLARVCAGGVATVPLRLPEVEAALEGRPATQETLAQAATHATAGATPLPGTAYKVRLLEGAVLTALERALEA